MFVCSHFSPCKTFYQNFDDVSINQRSSKLSTRRGQHIDNKSFSSSWNTSSLMNFKILPFLSTGFSKQMRHESDEQVQIKVNAELYLTFYATNLLLQINSSTYLNSLCFYGFQVDPLVMLSNIQHQIGHAVEDAAGDVTAKNKLKSGSLFVSIFIALLFEYVYKCRDNYFFHVSIQN